MRQAGTLRTTTHSAHPISQPPARRGAILIVEDREDVRQGLSQLLEFQGFMVFEAGDYQQAFAQLEASPQGIALILLDLDLPGPGGEELRAAQLADASLAGIPAIVVSACGPEIPGGDALRAAAWVEKPFRFDQLLDEVRRFVVPEAADDFKTSSSAQLPGA